MPCYYYWWWWGAQFYLIESRSAHLWLPGLLVHCYMINLQAWAAPSSKGNRHKRLLLFMTGHIFRCGASLDSLYVSVSVSVLKYHLQWLASSILLDTRTSKSKKISDKFSRQCIYWVVTIKQLDNFFSNNCSIIISYTQHFAACSNKQTKTRINISTELSPIIPHDRYVTGDCTLLIPDCVDTESCNQQWLGTFYIKYFETAQWRWRMKSTDWMKPLILNFILILRFIEIVS